MREIETLEKQHKLSVIRKKGMYKKFSFLITLYFFLKGKNYLSIFMVYFSFFFKQRSIIESNKAKWESKYETKIYSDWM